MAETGLGHTPAPAAIETVAAHALLQRIAWRPRLAGTVSEMEARNVCADRLRAQGFDVTEQVFEFSEFPGRWAPTIGAIALALLAFAAGHIAARYSMPLAALVVLVAGIATLGAAGTWMALRGTAGTPWMRCRSVNLVATRGSAEGGRPVHWLVAHIDSKSQTVPMLVRISSVFLSVVMVVVLTGALVDSALRGVSAPMFSLIPAIAWITIACLTPLMLCIVANRSCGSLDNGSGVAAVLMATRKLDSGRPLGVIITSAEELGLAGARAYVGMNPARGVALNCDTVDDRGRFYCMMHGSPSKSELAQAVIRASGKLGARIRLCGMFPGVLADNIAFTDAGWDSLTLSRGNLATLSRVHTAGDRPDKLDGSGIADAARLIAATIEELP